MHICCGPCAIYPFQNLTKHGFEVEGLFCNPNIQPQSEYSQRKEAVEDFRNKFGRQVYFADYQPDSYVDCIKTAKDKTARCKRCFDLRLKKTHQFALDKEFDLFTTTLLVSPYQDQQVIKQLGDKISEGSSAKFLFCDFRPGFRQAHNQAKQLGLYCQKYCGCLASLEERSKSKREKAKC